MCTTTNIRAFRNVSIIIGNLADNNNVFLFKFFESNCHFFPFCTNLSCKIIRLILLNSQVQQGMNKRNTELLPKQANYEPKATLYMYLQNETDVSCSNYINNLFFFLHKINMCRSVN